LRLDVKRRVRCFLRCRRRQFRDRDDRADRGRSSEVRKLSGDEWRGERGFGFSERRRRKKDG